MNRIEKLESFLRDSPNDSFLKHALALEYIKLGDDSKAKDLFTGLLTADPGYVGSYYHLGKLLERTGNKADAITTYEKGILIAGKAGDRHSASELQGALDELQS